MGMSGGESGDLARRLAEVLGPDRVRGDEATRHEYAMDASPGYVPPRAVVAPGSEDDVVATIRVCREIRVPITPRAAGTPLSGAAVGPGVVLDTTHLADVREFRREDGWIRVGPGLPLLELNAFLRPHGRFFPPDPGSEEWCRIGGWSGTMPPATGP